MSPEENSHQILKAMESLILRGSQLGRQAPYGGICLGLAYMLQMWQ